MGKSSCSLWLISSVLVGDFGSILALTFTFLQEKGKDVTVIAIADWEIKKRESGDGAREGELQYSELKDSQDTPPIDPSKRKRSFADLNPAPPEQPLPKKTRRVGTAETARFQSISQETHESGEILTEIKDSYEEDKQLSLYEVIQPRVEIPAVYDNFDRGAYSEVSATSSSSSQPQPSISIDSQSQSQLQTPIQRAKPSNIKDRDIILDSQALPDSSSSRPETESLSTVTSPGPIASTSAEENLEESQFRNTQFQTLEVPESSDVDSQYTAPQRSSVSGLFQQQLHSEPYQSPYASHSQVTTGFPTVQRIDPSSEELQPSHQVSVTNSVENIDESLLSAPAPSSPAQQKDPGHSELQLQSEGSSIVEDRQIEGAWSQEAALTSSREASLTASQEAPLTASQVPRQQNSEQEEEDTENSDLQFQTQVPLLRDEGESSQQNNPVTDRSVPASVSDRSITRFV